MARTAPSKNTPKTADGADRPAPHFACALKRPLTKAGVEYAIGETVTLRADQVERLAPAGYFESQQPAEPPAGD